MTAAVVAGPSERGEAATARDLRSYAGRPRLPGEAIAMTNGPTCGQGLAEHSALPGKLGEVVAALAANLHEHLPALDAEDDAARAEQRAYESLISKFRSIA